MSPSFVSKSRIAQPLAAAFAASFLFVCGAAMAADFDMPRRTIVVSGQGEVGATPDQARLTAGVVTQETTAAAALDANTRAMNNVFAALRQLGISDNKVRTSNFTLTPQYAPVRGNNPEPRSIAGYQVSNQVTVILDDVSKLGAALDTLIRSGANQSGGVSFGISDTKPLADRARRAAVADAIAKAKALAEAAGVTLGPILSIQDGGVANIGGPRMYAAAAVAALVPVSAGEQTVSVNVSVTYAIQ